jgi:nucleoside-diphosphate-sugar epimerase
LLVSGADGNVSRHLVNALAATGHRRRGGDIRHPMRARSPAHLMSHAAPGRTSHDFSVRRVVGSAPGSAREGEAIYARIARPSGAGEAARSAAQGRRHQSITAE